MFNLPGKQFFFKKILNLPKKHGFGDRGVLGKDRITQRVKKTKKFSSTSDARNILCWGLCKQNGEGQLLVNSVTSTLLHVESYLFN